MRILGIDSSSLVASVALVTDEVLTAEYTVDFKKTHSQTLLPMLDAMMSLLGIPVREVDAIAVAAGPGSFTGLRIGAATAKGLGLALDIPLVRVPTVDALAYNLWGAKEQVCPIMDARRGQVYTGLYRMENGIEAIMPQCPMNMEELLGWLGERGEPVIFLGDGVPVYKPVIEKGAAFAYRFAPAHLNRQRAGAVATLAGLVLKGDGAYTGGCLVSADAFEPEYLRLSQAERQRKEKEAGAG